MESNEEVIMGIIKRMTLEKNESLEIAKRTEELFLNEHLSYESALKMAKEEFIDKELQKKLSIEPIEEELE